MPIRTPFAALALAVVAATGCMDRELPFAAAPVTPAFDDVPGHFVVNNASDASTGGCTPEECTLREAVEAAMAAGVPATITFDLPGCSTPETCTIQLTTRIFIHEVQLSIDGGGRPITIRAGGSTNVFVVDGQALHLEEFPDAVVTLENLTITGGTGEMGGAIENWGILTINGSTISGNRAASRGGGILNAGTLTIVNSTISGNESRDSHGGGIYNAAGANLTFVNSTISGNHAGTFGGGIFYNSPVTLRNTIVAGNTSGFGDADCHKWPLGTLTSDGYNLTGHDTGCSLAGTGDRTVPADAVFTSVLDPTLSYNGGPTPTHALLAGSPAIDAIPVGTNGCGQQLATDQRGETRPQGPACDIGAFEVLANANPAFGGFLTPLDPGRLNEVKAGRGVPVKFSLGAYFGMDILASGYPVSAVIECPDGATVASDVITTSAGSSSLSYDPDNDHYVYIWATERFWAGTCRRFTLMLKDDGVARTVDFHFVR